LRTQRKYKRKIGKDIEPQVNTGKGPIAKKAMGQWKIGVFT
jgi:hypothetical protein